MKVSFRYLKAVLPCAATFDSRSYLCGVHVKATADAVIYEATDGHTAARIVQTPQPSEPCEFDLIIPHAVVKGLKLPKHIYGESAANMDTLTLSIDADKATLTYIDGSAVTFKSITGYYPDVAAVTPKPSGQPGNYDFDLLARFSDCAKALGAKQPGAFCRLYQNGPDGPALVKLAGFDEFTGIIAPIRV